MLDFPNYCFSLATCPTRKYQGMTAISGSKIFPMREKKDIYIEKSLLLVLSLNFVSYLKPLCYSLYQFQETFWANLINKDLKGAYLYMFKFEINTLHQGIHRASGQTKYVKVFKDFVNACVWGVDMDRRRTNLNGFDLCQNKSHPRNMHQLKYKLTIFYLFCLYQYCP